MKSYQINIAKTYIITAEDIDDIVASAFEGGITYWCGEADVVGEYLGEYESDQISRGGSLILYDAESDDKWELNLDKILTGIEKAINDSWFADYDWYLPDGTLDTCQIDGEVADVIIQLSLFNEVVFG